MNAKRCCEETDADGVHRLSPQNKYAPQPNGSAWVCAEAYFIPPPDLDRVIALPVRQRVGAFPGVFGIGAKSVRVRAIPPSTE